MKIEYNPFSKKTIQETKHGTINYQHDLGTTYTTFRKTEHYFKKYQGFGISITEAEICYEKNVYWIIIIYTDKKERQKAYRIKLEKLRYLEQYNNNGDQQIIIPTKCLQEKKEEKWE